MKPVQIYLCLKGRLSLKQYWLFWIIPFSVIFLVLYYLDKQGYSLGTNTIKATNILIIWPFIATSVKRLHDMNKSGWWFLLNLIPFIGNILIGLILCLIPGTRGQNEYS